MDAGQLAAVIAASSFAVLACAGVFVLIRLARLMSAVTGLVTEYRTRADQLIERAQAAVDRTNEQLVRTDAITASMDQVTANMAELSGHVTVLTGLVRAVSAAATAPLTWLSALLFGVRRAAALRQAPALRQGPAPRQASVPPARSAISGAVTRPGSRP